MHNLSSPETIFHTNMFQCFKPIEHFHVLEFDYVNFRCQYNSMGEIHFDGYYEIKNSEMLILTFFLDPQLKC